MNKIISSILGFVMLLTIIGCSDDTDPKFRVYNERSSQANVQIQKTGGNTININDVEPRQTTEYQFATEGNITATAVIQNEAISPSITFFAAKDSRYTIVIKNGSSPYLMMDIA